jgi:hypothetical protein
MCICNGAVVLDHDVASEVKDGGLHASNVVLDENRKVELLSTSAAVADRGTGPPTSLPSGRLIRILHESFLL